MAPGEWLRVPTRIPAGFRDFKTFQCVAEADGSKSIDGMGWTERVVEHNGALIPTPLMRYRVPSLIRMDREGAWDRITDVFANFPPHPSDKLLPYSSRRPFNRWYTDGQGFGYLSVADPWGQQTAHGYMLRTPLEGPGYGVFEKIGPAAGDSQFDSTGNHSACFAWGRHWLYSAGGKVRSWAEGEAGWRLHTEGIAKDERPDGYAGTIFYNSVRNEVLAIGSQYFGDTPDSSHQVLVVRRPDQQAVRLTATREDGSLFQGITASSKKFAVHPRTGDYLMFHNEIEGVKERHLYSSPDGGKWTLIHDFGETAPWGSYELYMPMTHLSGTDCLVGVSHRNGVLLFCPA